MMSNQDSGESFHSETNVFGPLQFIKEIYSDEISTRPLDKELCEWLMDKMHTVFVEGKYRGKTLLDIGSGPVVYPVITASKWFDEVFLSDISAANIDFLHKWKQGEPDATEAMKYLMNYFAIKDGKGTLWQVQNEQVRKKVKDAIKWDMHKPQMLEGTALDGVQFDVVTASLCMCAASSTIEAYAEVIENIREILKPGGRFIVCDVMDQTWYAINDEKFSVLSTTEEDIEAAFLKNGFEIEQFETHKLCAYPEPLQSDAKTVYCIIAKKL